MGNPATKPDGTGAPKDGDLQPLVHVAAWVKSTGGVETLLARHAAADARLGFAARQLALFDRPGPRRDGAYETLAFDWRSTPRRMRAAVARSLASTPGAVVAWHNGWGLAWFADLDGSSRRIACFEDSEAHFGPILPRLAALIDGATCLCEDAAVAIRRLAPALAQDGRVVVTPLPLEAGAASTDRPRRGEWVIGCAGRLVRTQKRWDRLVPFVAELRRLGLPCRIEIVSDGPLRPWLERQFRADPAVSFLGWQGREEYWRRLAGWDAAVFFSDHEGGPIVLLEALAAGVIPVYPAIGGSLGDDHIRRVEPRCFYPPGDAVAAARTLATIRSWPDHEIAALRGRAQASAARHGGTAYEETFGRFAHHLASLPRISRPPGSARPPRGADHLPLGLITRFLPDALLT